MNSLNLTFISALALAMSCLITAIPVMTTHDKLAHLSTNPCNPELWGTTVDTNDDTSDDTNTSLTQLDNQENLVRLKAVTSKVKEILSLLINDTMEEKLLCKNATIVRIRQHYNFQWTLSSLDGMDDDKADRLKFLVEISAYVIYIRSTLQMDESDQIYGDFSVTLKDLKYQLRLTACKLRDLIPDIESNIIETHIKKSKKSTGQAVFETLRHGTAQQIYRYLTCGAIYDMYDSFSRLDTYLVNAPTHVPSD